MCHWLTLITLNHSQQSKASRFFFIFVFQWERPSFPFHPMALTILNALNSAMRVWSEKQNRCQCLEWKTWNWFRFGKTTHGLLNFDDAGAYKVKIIKNDSTEKCAVVKSQKKKPKIFSRNTVLYCHNQRRQLIWIWIYSSRRQSVDGARRNREIEEMRKKRRINSNGWWIKFLRGRHDASLTSPRRRQLFLTWMRQQFHSYLHFVYVLCVCVWLVRVVIVFHVSLSIPPDRIDTFAWCVCFRFGLFWT